MLDGDLFFSKYLGVGVKGTALAKSLWYSGCTNFDGTSAWGVGCCVRSGTYL